MSEALLASVADALVPRIAEVAEVYGKEGRSRFVRWDDAGYTMAVRHEEGWAVRAGGRDSGFFLASTGQPDPAAKWPGLRSASLRLADPSPVPGWTEPPELTVPMITENEGMALVEALRRGLGEEVPDARLRWVELEDGDSRSELYNTRGMRAGWRHRSATLRVALTAPGLRDNTLTMELAAREARAFHPKRISRRLADRLLVRQKGQAPERDRGEFLLAPEVSIRLLSGLLPLFVGPGADRRLAGLRDRSDRVASPLCTLVDDGRLAGGALAAAVDGEGLATRRTVLVNRGLAVQPLLSWWDAKRRAGCRPGSSRRDSWRDPPRLGPTHLFIEPSSVSVADLLGAVPRGYYLIDASGSGRFDFDADRFALQVGGFALTGGRVRHAITGGWLCGSIGAFLRGVQAVGRDLTFLPVDGMIGSPSLVATGLELRS